MEIVTKQFEPRVAGFLRRSRFVDGFPRRATVDEHRTRSLRLSRTEPVVPGPKGHLVTTSRAGGALMREDGR